MKDTWLDLVYYFSQFTAIFFMLWIALEPSASPVYRALMVTAALMAYSQLLKHEIKQ